MRPQFAVVREDPEIECAIIARHDLQNALVVASGGCTALTLADRFPDMRTAAFDLNPHQLEHVRHKLDAVATGQTTALGVDVDGGLNQCGAFEGLFRVLRHAIEEFVAPPKAIKAWFDQGGDAIEGWFGSKYWPAAFAMAFSDPLLLAMFGPDAIQHAAPGSYPGYFQSVFERGLRQPEGRKNPFLQHVLLGHYRRKDAPAHIFAGRPLDIDLIEGTLMDVPDLESYGLISLSNIFDWSNDALVAAWADALSKRAHIGAMIVIRQLNNTRDLRPFFEPCFTFNGPMGQSLLEGDRSLFYNRIEVAMKRKHP